MGVLACDRNKCENVMCDTCIAGSYYICDECIEEFKDQVRNSDLNLTHEGEIEREIIKFIATDKNTFNLGKAMSVDEYLHSRSMGG